jgi:3-oxoacyl-[acyl-carrier-protein] synthase-3
MADTPQPPPPPVFNPAAAIRPAVVAGTGSAVPDRIVTNDDIAAMGVDTSDEWIRQRTGIAERRVADLPLQNSDLAAEASQKALDAAGMSAMDLDLVVCATITQDYCFPTTGCLVQKKLGAERAGAIDIVAACSGFVYGLGYAWGLVSMGVMNNVLVIGSEVMSRILNWTDRNSCILFGDAAGAAVITAGTPGQKGIRDVRLCADGGHADVLGFKASGTAVPTTHETVEAGEHFININGRDVFKFAVSRFRELAEEALERNGLTVNDVDLVVPHQVNARIIESALKKLDFPDDKIFMNLEKYGNTSAASIPLALDEAQRAGRLKKGDTVLLVAFGAGLTWGSAVLEW